MVAPSWESFQRPQDFNNQPEEMNPSLDFQQQEFQQEEPGEMIDSESPEGEQPSWGNFDTPETNQGPIDPTEEESTIGYFVRNIAANASRVGEQIVGRAGNLEKFGKDILSNFPEAGGLLSLGLSQLMGPERWEQMVKGRLGQVYPTSEQLEKSSGEITGGYTEPKTPGEKKFQGAAKDIASTIGGRGSPFRGKLANVSINNLGIPLAANAVEKIVGDLGFGKDKATYSKLATWTALSFLGNISAPQYASDLMNQGRKGVPDNLLFDLPRMQNRLQQVSKSPRLLMADPRSALARQQLAAVQNDLASGQTNVRSLMNTYDGINAAKRSRGLFEFNKSDQGFARAAIDEVKNAVKAEILESSHAFPEAMQNWTNGIQAWSVIHQSKGITNWLDILARGPYAKSLSGPATGLLGMSGYGAFKSPLIAGPAAAAIPAGYKTFQTAYRVWNDPRLAKYYWNSIAAAKAENAHAFISNFNKLNEGIKKSDAVEKKKKKSSSK